MSQCVGLHLVSKREKDGARQNAKLKASNWPFTSQWVTSYWFVGDHSGLPLGSSLGPIPPRVVFKLVLYPGDESGANSPFV